MEETEKTLKKNIRINKIKIFADVILIILFIGIGIYMFKEIENFKILGSDVCELCMQKTGGICSTGIGPLTFPN